MPKAARLRRRRRRGGGEWGGMSPLPSRQVGLAERRKLPKGVRGAALAENWFPCILRFKNQCVDKKIYYFSVSAICGVISDPPKQINKRNYSGLMVKNAWESYPAGGPHSASPRLPSWTKGKGVSSLAEFIQ